MNVLDEILLHPKSVVEVIKILTVKLMLDNDAPTSDESHVIYGRKGLDWWNEIMAGCRKMDPDVSEISVADYMIKMIREQDVWGKILRRGMN